MINTSSFLLCAAVLLSSLCSCGSRNASAPDRAPDVRVEEDSVIVSTGCRFIERLSVACAKEGADDGAGVRFIGQVVAIANSPTNPMDKGVDWVELDPRLIKDTGFNLAGYSKARAGDVLGMADIPASYARKISVGGQVLVGRYGMSQSAEKAKVVFMAVPRRGRVVPILFWLRDTLGWLPGSNCEVLFPVMRHEHMKVPAKALLHEGMHEYVLEQTGPGRFVPRMVIVGNEDSGQMDIVAGLQPGACVVGRGAILLKPFLSRILKHDRGTP